MKRIAIAGRGVRSRWLSDERPWRVFIIATPYARTTVRVNTRAHTLTPGGRVGTCEYDFEGREKKSAFAERRTALFRVVATDGGKKKKYTNSL